MKRRIAALALMMMVAMPGVSMAATLRPIDQEGVNLREGPGTSFKILGALAVTDKATVIGQQDNWYKVRTASGLEAWVANWVSVVNYEDEQADAIVNTDELNLRKEPKLGTPVLAVLKQDQRVRLLEVAGGWWKVRTAAGLVGWVSAEYMKRAPATPPPAPDSQPGPTPGPAPSPAPSPTPTPTPAPSPGPTPTPAPPVTGGVSELPPPAPAWVVPVLAPLPATPDPRPAGAKQVHVIAKTLLYTGRDRALFDWVEAVDPGDAVAYVDAAEGWVKLKTPAGKQGWAPGAAVAITEGKWLFNLTEGRWTLGLTNPAPATPIPPIPPPAQPKPGPDKRVVRDPEGLRLRQAPAFDGAIITVLPLGTVLTVLEAKAPWIRVNTDKGQTGWVHGDYAYPYAEPGAPPTPAGPAPTFSGAVKATLAQVRPGVLQLDVEAPGKAIGEPKVDGATLTIALATGESQGAQLPVGMAGALALVASPNALTLSLDSMPAWEVTQQAPGKLSIVLRPLLTSVTVNDLADRTIYTIKTQGPVAPKARAARGEVTVTFPGANLGWGGSAGQARLTGDDNGVTLAITSRRPYALKRTSTGFELHLYNSGLVGKTILLDPGHGGADPGAVNAKTGVREKEINLQVALRLRALLAAKGATVLMTRIGDTQVAPLALTKGAADPLHVDLGYRTRMANEARADMFVSIHHNCCEGSGTETYYTASTLNGERSAALAKLMQKEVSKGLGQTDRGAINDLMFVTRTTDAPAVLQELAFMSHPIEGRLVSNPLYQEQAARLMLSAIERFYAEATD